MDFIFVPTVLFMVVVAPIWIVMHYKSAGRSSKGLNEQDRVVIDDMLRTVDKLTDRIDALERILDADSPQWKSR
jgi:phage shock protein B